MRSASNAYEEQIQEYFKTIEGLKIYSEDKDWYRISFEIFGDVDNIISQITEDSLKMFLDAKKYNIG